MQAINVVISTLDFRPGQKINLGDVTKSTFEVVSIDSEDELKNILNTKVHSTHYFPNLTDEEKERGVSSIRASERTERSYGIILNLNNELTRGGQRIHEEQLTIDRVKEIMDSLGIAYIIYTSKFHRIIKPGYEQDKEVDRYHIYVPFAEPIDYAGIEGPKDSIFKAIFEHFDQRLKHYADPACADLARIYYPSQRTDAEYYIELDRPYFDWRKDIKYQQSDDYLFAAGMDYQQLYAEEDMFRLNQVVRLAKGNKYVKIGDIHKKQDIYCPFHDDTLSTASVDFDSNGTPFIYCSVCRDAGRGRWGSFRLRHVDQARIRKKMEGLYTFLDKKSLKYYIYDDYDGLRSAFKSHIENSVRSLTGNKPGIWNIHSVEYRYGEKFGIIENGAVYNARKSMPALEQAIEMKEKGGTQKDAVANMPTIRVLFDHMFPNPDHRKYFLHFILIRALYCRHLSYRRSSLSENARFGKADAPVRHSSYCFYGRTRACPSACPDESQEKLGTCALPQSNPKAILGQTATSE